MHVVRSASEAGDSAGGGTLAACDALAPKPLPIALTALLGVGKDDSGTLYVADEGDPRSQGPRVFIGRDHVLVRQRVTGSGSNGGGADADYTLSIEDGQATRRLVIQIRGGKPTGMALANDSGKSFYADLGSAAMQLTIVNSTLLERTLDVGGTPLPLTRDDTSVATGTFSYQCFVP